MNKIMQENLEDLTSSALWRALAAELVGTLFVVLIGCGAIDNNGSVLSPNIVQVSLAFGLIFGSMVWCFNYVSGGHLNPAITVAAMVCRRVSIVRGILYIISQMVGAIAGAAILYAVSGNLDNSTLGATVLANNITAAQGFIIELIITFVLVFVVLAATDEKRSDLGGSAPLSIGLAVAAGHLFAVSLLMFLSRSGFLLCAANSLLTFATFCANSADDKLIIFFLFSQKVGFDISCKLSPLETTCMKCQILFSGEKYFKISSAENFTQSDKCKLRGIDSQPCQKCFLTF